MTPKIVTARFLRYFLAAKSGIKKLIIISIGKAVSTKVDANHLRMQTYIVSAKSWDTQMWHDVFIYYRSAE